MSYDKLLVSLKSPIKEFRELQQENILVPLLSVEQIQRDIQNLFPEIKWNKEKDGIYFGCTPCAADISMEIWVVERPYFTLKISHTTKDVAVDIARELNLTAIDVQTGEVIYSQFFE